MTQPYTLPYLEIFLRLLAAFACGAVIGLNREFHRKPAGFRTFGLLAIGCAVMVLVMQQMAGIAPDAVSRVIQGVLTGVGFLGAGVIFRREHPYKIGGLTTAAAVWLTAGLSIAAGAGLYFIAFSAAGLGLLLLLLGGPFERLVLGKPKKSETDEEDEEPPT